MGCGYEDRKVLKALTDKAFVAIKFKLKSTLQIARQADAAVLFGTAKIDHIARLDTSPAGVSNHKNWE
jgi:hypothetical protein